MNFKCSKCGYTLCIIEEIKVKSKGFLNWFLYDTYSAIICGSCQYVELFALHKDQISSKEK